MRMARLFDYLARLSHGRLILWCYFIWYVVNVGLHFTPHPRLWLTSLGLSAIIGAALIISTQSATGRKSPLDRWVVFRLFLMPFCVSSFAALVKDAGYILIFPPSLRANLIGLFLIGLFLLIVRASRARTQLPAGSATPAKAALPPATARSD